MRAYISDIDGGPVFLDQENPLGSVFDTPAKDYAARWAEREALTVLSMTEPRTELSDFYESSLPWPSHLPICDGPTHSNLRQRVRVNVAANLGKYVLMPIEAAALAESLAAVLPVLDAMEREARS